MSRLEGWSGPTVRGCVYGAAGVLIERGRATEDDRPRLHDELEQVYSRNPQLWGREHDGDRHTALADAWAAGATPVQLGLNP